MKKVLLFSILALIASPFVQVGCQNSMESSGGVEVSPSVLKTAEWAGFDYKGTLDKALAGDAMSIQKFLKFHGTVDGVEGIQHGVACLEMIPIVGDEVFAGACLNLSANLHKVLLDRLMQAQGRTKKEELRKSMTNWAPLTWSVINGKGMPATGGASIQQLPEEQKKGGPSSEAAKPAPSNVKGRE